MPIVQSFGALAAMSGAPLSFSSGSGGSVALYDSRVSYARLYASQPNVRTCVDFLARNCAQLAPHAFRRVSDTDRVRLADHDVIRWLGRPAPTTTLYRLIEGIVSDLGIYFDAYALKVRTIEADGRPRIGLVRLPPEEVTPKGGLTPSYIEWLRNGVRRDFALSEIIHWSGYNPLNPLNGLPALETLRRILAEEAAAGQHRESYWTNAGRQEGVIEQSAAGPSWSDQQKKDFRAEWQEYARGGGKQGMVAVLPKGMTYKANSFSARDSEYVSGRKLTREECAAAFHIPLPMVGILEHATFSNIKEQHKHLYQDCLGPWLEMITQELEAQLLIESADQSGVYLEFNIQEKLKGSFEEQASALQAVVGQPIMTQNEGRARVNLPRHEGKTADELGTQPGVGARPAPGAPGSGNKASYYDPADEADADAQQTRVKLEGVVRRHWQRQATKLVRLAPEARVGAFNQFRAIAELAEDVAPLIGLVAGADYALRITQETAARIAAGLSPFAEDREVMTP